MKGAKMTEKIASDRLHTGELIHDGLLYDHVNTELADLPFYLEWCRKAGGAILELCCGTGRLTIPLKETGLDITGLDISDSMLTRAGKKAAGKGFEIEFMKRDATRFSLDKKYSLIFIPFNSLQCFYSIAEVEAVFANVRNHLHEDGLFIFEVFNPNIYFMVEGSDAYKEIQRFHLEDGRPVVISEKTAYDEASQVNRVRWKYRIGDRETEQNLDMRCYYPLEMDALLKYNRFETVSKFGAYDKEPFHSKSPKQIYICRPKNRL